MMCKEPCDKLVNYLKLKKCRSKEYRSNYDVYNFFGISWGIRNNTIVLCKDDTHWRWHRDEPL
jgi:hypothetical protein